MSKSYVTPITPSTNSTLPKPFWILWAVELWERFGYYGMQAIIPLFFPNTPVYMIKLCAAESVTP